MPWIRPARDPYGFHDGRCQVQNDWGMRGKHGQPKASRRYSEMVIYSSSGNIVVTSPAVFVDPGPGGGLLARVIGVTGPANRYRLPCLRGQRRCHCSARSSKGADPAGVIVVTISSSASATTPTPLRRAREPCSARAGHQRHTAPPCPCGARDRAAPGGSVNPELRGTAYELSLRAPRQLERMLSEASTARPDLVRGRRTTAVLIHWI